MIGFSFDIVKTIIKTLKKRFNMFNEFDDLFDEFFNNSFFNRRPSKGKGNSKLDDMRNLVDKLNNFDELDGLTNPHEEELGEPDETVTFEENGYVFEKNVWHLEHGSIVKVHMVSSPLDSGFTPKRKKLTLEDRLAVAIEEERYEDAAKIRDEIKARDEKATDGESKNNKGFPEK